MLLWLRTKYFSKSKSLDYNAMITLQLTFPVCWLWLLIPHDPIWKTRGIFILHQHWNLRKLLWSNWFTTTWGHIRKQCTSRCQTVGAKCSTTVLLMLQLLIYVLGFQGVGLFHLSFASCNLVHHHSKIKGKSSKPLILGNPLDISCFHVKMEILYISFPPYILLLFYIVNQIKIFPIETR